MRAVRRMLRGVTVAEEARRAAERRGVHAVPSGLRARSRGVLRRALAGRAPFSRRGVALLRASLQEVRRHSCSRGTKSPPTWFVES
jgi:hypothetical protein